MRILKFMKLLVNWLLLPFIALSLGCGPLVGDGSKFPSLQIDVEFADTAHHTIDVYDLIVTLRDSQGTIITQGHGNPSIASGSVSDNCMRFNFQEGARGAATVELAADWNENTMCGANWVKGPAPIQITEDKTYFMQVSFSNPAKVCLLTVSLEGPDKRSDSESVGTVQVIPLMDSMSGNCKPNCYYHLATPSQVTLIANDSQTAAFSTWQTEGSGTPDGNQFTLPFETGRRVTASYLKSNCVPGGYCQVRSNSSLGQDMPIGNLVGIWGRPPDPSTNRQELWAVGSHTDTSGVVLYYDGTSWREARFATNKQPKGLNAVWGDASLRTAWVVGSRDVDHAGIYHCAVGVDGSTICSDVVTSLTGATYVFPSVSMVGSVVWMVDSGGTVFRGVPKTVGATVQLDLVASFPAIQNPPVQIWAASESVSFVVGETETRSQCTYSPPGKLSCPSSATGSADHYVSVTGFRKTPASVWVANSSSSLTHYSSRSGGPPTWVSGGPFPGAKVQGLWADDADPKMPTVWAVSDHAGTPLAYWLDAAPAVVNTIQTPAPKGTYNAVWAYREHVWMVGKNGAIAHYQRN